GQQAAKPVIHLRPAEAKDFSQESLQGVGLEVDQQEQQLLFRGLKHPGPAAPGRALARASRRGAVGGRAALVGTYEGRQQEVKFRWRQACEGQTPFPIAPEFRVGHHKANVFLNSDKVYYWDRAGWPRRRVGWPPRSP